MFIPRFVFEPVRQEIIENIKIRLEKPEYLRTFEQGKILANEIYAIADMASIKIDDAALRDESGKIDAACKENGESSFEASNSSMNINEEKCKQNSENGNPTPTIPTYASILEMLTQQQIDRRRPESELRIPEVELPTFEGNIRQYKSFKDTFLSIMQHCQISDVEKFLLLRSKLSGAALVTIENLEMIGENYETIWERLDAKFKDERVFIEDCIRSILYANPTVAGKPETILQFMQNYQQALHNLELLDIDIQHPCLRVIILDKMDSHTSARFEDRTEHTKMLPTIEEIDAFLEKEYHVSGRFTKR